MVAVGDYIVGHVCECAKVRNNGINVSKWTMAFVSQRDGIEV